jgi:hypothetical protein
MRLSELLGRHVRSANGDTIGYVADLRLVQDGPPIGPYAASLRLDGFIVVQRRHSRLLGYDRDVGPWYLRAAIRYLTGDPLYVSWQQVGGVDQDAVLLTADANNLARLRDLPDHQP